MNYKWCLTFLYMLSASGCLQASAQQVTTPQAEPSIPANAQTNLTFGPGGLIPSSNLPANTFSAPAAPTTDNQFCRRLNVIPHRNPYPANFGGQLPSNVKVLPGPFTTYGKAPQYVKQAPGWQATYGGKMPDFIKTTDSWGFTYGGKTPDFIRIGGSPPGQ